MSCEIFYYVDAYCVEKGIRQNESIATPVNGGASVWV
jgi:hypothetical protein